METFRPFANKDKADDPPPFAVPCDLNSCLDDSREYILRRGKGGPYDSDFCHHFQKLYDASALHTMGPGWVELAIDLRDRGVIKWPRRTYSFIKGPLGAISILVAIVGVIVATQARGESVCVVTGWGTTCRPTVFGNPVDPRHYTTSNSAEEIARQEQIRNREAWERATRSQGNADANGNNAKRWDDGRR